MAAPGIGIDFEAHGEVQVSRELMRVGGRIENPRPLWKSLLDFILQVNKRNFNSQGRFQSGGWAPLKPETIEAKRRAGQDLRILRREGDLFKSLTMRGGANQLLELGLNQLVFGSNLFYAKFHQKGNPGGNLPRRAPMEFKENTRREIVKRTQRYILTGKVA